jgi:lipopolysaccharide/colanic/teichoic acid biosynthesis glycosyltransferase
MNQATVTNMSRTATASANTFELPRAGEAEYAPIDRRAIRVERDSGPGRANRLRNLQNRACRVLNVLVALVGIVLTFPAMLILAALVKMSSPGPVFYSQPRVGLDRRTGSDRRGGGRGSDMGRRKSDSGGRVFRIYKFRTMRAAVEGEAQQVWATQDDPRITRIGRILRKYRLDELPQLFNVLLGDMNVVGPRPEQPEIVRKLRTEVDGYLGRQRVLPGITGWAQVNQSYDACIDDVRKKVNLDLEYIGRRSVAKDLQIMARTLPVMIGKKGAI